MAVFQQKMQTKNFTIFSTIEKEEKNENPN
jgi:hypothetical protein